MKMVTHVVVYIITVSHKARVMMVVTRSMAYHGNPKSGVLIEVTRISDPIHSTHDPDHSNPEKSGVS